MCSASLLRVTATCLLAVVLSCASTSATAARARSAVLRDVEGYAIASCLASQDQPYLKDQGDGWASAIVQRGKGDLDALTGVATQVKIELAKGEVAVIRSETAPMRDTPLPVLYCCEIIDTAGVRAAIDRALIALSPAYQ